MTGANGGAAFVALYVIVTFLVGLPVMITELAIGRAGRGDAVKSLRKLCPSKPWWTMGVAGILSAFLILAFYVARSSFPLRGGLFEGNLGHGACAHGSFVLQAFRRNGDDDNLRQLLPRGSEHTGHCHQSDVLGPPGFDSRRSGRVPHRLCLRFSARCWTPSLLFITMPAVFASMPLGRVFVPLFFILAGIAATGAMLSLFEVPVAFPGGARVCPGGVSGFIIEFRRNPAGKGLFGRSFRT